MIAVVVVDWGIRRGAGSAVSDGGIVDSAGGGEAAGEGERIIDGLDG